MKKVRNAVRAVVLALLLAVGVSAAAVTLTEEEQAACEAEGGCAVMSRARFMHMLQKAYEAGKAEANASCRSRT